MPAGTAHFPSGHRSISLVRRSGVRQAQGLWGGAQQPTDNHHLAWGKVLSRGEVTTCVHTLCTITCGICHLNRVSGALGFMNSIVVSESRVSKANWKEASMAEPPGSPVPSPAASVIKTPAPPPPRVWGRHP